jgi:hypothetical protein
MMKLSCPIPVSIISEANQSWLENRHAKGRRVKQQRGAVKVYLRALLCRIPGERFPLPATVTLTRISARRLDGDNLQRAFKAVRDEVAALLGVDDGSPLVEWLYAQEKSTRPKQSTIRIDIASKAEEQGAAR